MGGAQRGSVEGSDAGDSDAVRAGGHHHKEEGLASLLGMAFLTLDLVLGLHSLFIIDGSWFGPGGYRMVGGGALVATEKKRPCPGGWGM